MIEYARAMYQAWSQGRSTQDCCRDSNLFVQMCCEQFARSPDEIIKILCQQSWWPGSNDLDIPGT
jgi:hypothetical protein